MADARISFRVIPQLDLSPVIHQLRQAADALEALQREPGRPDVVDQYTDPDIVGDTKGG